MQVKDLMHISWSTGQQTESTQINNKGTYSIKVKLDGCFDYDTIKIIENPKPIINLGADREVDPDKPVIESLDAGAGYSKYLWNTLQQTQTIVVNKKGIYWVKVEDDKGCNGTDTIEIKFKIKSGLNSFEQSGIRVYPNPAKDVLNIESEYLPITSVNLIDMQGRVVLKDNTKGMKIFVSTPNLSSGIYVLKIYSDSISNTVKIYIVQ